MEIKTFGKLKTLMAHELETKSERRIAALKRLFQYQTISERYAGKTHFVNGEGFNKADAPTLTSLLIEYNNKGKLTEKQHKLLYFKLKKYAGQLCRISINKKLIQKVDGKYIWCPRLRAESKKIKTKQEIAIVAKEWINGQTFFKIGQYEILPERFFNADVSNF